MTTLDEIKLDPQGRKIFEPDGAYLTAFMLDRSPVSIIRGPIGSGTSSACCQKIWQIACEQAPAKDGTRRSRWGVIRNTFPQLETTTLKTWLFWFEENMYGRLKRSKPMVHHIRVGDVDLEVLFAALDDEESIANMRSMEMTGFWFNELEYIPKSIFDEATSRVGRYPPIALSPPTWYGVLADLNAPNEDHWLPALMGEVAPPEDMAPDELAEYTRPEGWCYLVQPPALIEVFGDDGKTVVGYKPNPEAENKRWLPPGYYDDQVKGKKRSWIDSRLMNRITLHVEGKRVWPEFVPETHIAKQELKPVPNHPVYVGLDFWRSPAAVFGQLVGNRWHIQHELQGLDMGATQFAPMVKRVLEQKYPNYTFYAYGDPKGQDKGQNDDRTAYEIFRAFHIPVVAAPVKQNNIETRLEAVRFALNGMIDGMPRFLLSPSCRILKVGMAGGYHYKKVKGTQRYSLEPEKNRYSHPADALQYMFLGAGEGRQMRGALPGVKSAPVSTRPQTHTRRRYVG